MKDSSGSSECVRCHSPRANDAAAGARDVVTCDACHLAERVEHDANGFHAVMRRDDVVRFGPLCDATPSYFHRAACSTAFKGSQLCASCHDWSRRLPSGEELVVFGEFREWQASGYAMAASDCTDCHMPVSPGAVAVGSRPRERVADHGLRGGAPSLRGTGLSVRASIEQSGGKPVVVVVVANQSAGHAIPTGLPEREVALVVRALDAKGAELEQTEVLYGRRLVDASGVRVPFYLAAREAADTRIGAGQTRVERFPIHASRAVSIDIRILRRDLAAELAARGELPRGEEQTVTHLVVAMPQGARPGLEEAR